MSDGPPPRDPARGGPVRPAVALGYAVVGFVALAICGLGVTSLLTDQDVISLPGFGQVPGIVGMILATVAFAGTLWSFLRAERPPYFGAFTTGVLTIFGYLVGIVVGALLAGADIAMAAAAAGGVALSWFGLVVTLAAFAAGWAGIALVRTRARRPRWPWERDDE